MSHLWRTLLQWSDPRRTLLSRSACHPTAASHLRQRSDLWRTLLQWVLLLGCLSLSGGMAWAEALSLRMPGRGMRVSLCGGLPHFSAGLWFSDRLGLSLDAEMVLAPERVALGSLGASFGASWLLTGRSEGWRLDARVAGGLLFPTIEPGLALTVTPTLQGGYYGHRFFLLLDLVSPSALQFIGRVEARLPLILELWLAIRAGPVWIGLQGGAGVVFVPGQAPAGTAQALLFVLLEWNRLKEASIRR